MKYIKLFYIQEKSLKYLNKKEETKNINSEILVIPSTIDNCFNRRNLSSSQNHCFSPLSIHHILEHSFVRTPLFLPSSRKSSLINFQHVSLEVIFKNNLVFESIKNFAVKSVQNTFEQRFYFSPLANFLPEFIYFQNYLDILSKHKLELIQKRMKKDSSGEKWRLFLDTYIMQLLCKTNKLSPFSLYDISGICFRLVEFIFFCVNDYSTIKQITLLKN